jgi:hypothetical protein
MSLFADLTLGVNAVRPGRTAMRNYDLALFLAVAALLSMGLLMVYSASIALADGPGFGRRYLGVAHTHESGSKNHDPLVCCDGRFVGDGFFAGHWARSQWR